MSQRQIGNRLWALLSLLLSLSILIRELSRSLSLSLSRFFFPFSHRIIPLWLLLLALRLAFLNALTLSNESAPPRVQVTLLGAHSSLGRARCIADSVRRSPTSRLGAHRESGFSDSPFRDLFVRAPVHAVSTSCAPSFILYVDFCPVSAEASPSRNLSQLFGSNVFFYFPFSSFFIAFICMPVPTDSAALPR